MRLSTISRPIIVLPVVFGSVAFTQDDTVHRLNEVPTAERLKAWHDMVASVPHVAGTEGDWHVINELARSFGEMGYGVDVHEIWPLLSYPVSAEVEVIHPTIEPGTGLLPLREVPLAADPYSGADDLPFGFNAYSGSGEALGEVVYANFGRKEDFEKLRELGVDCAGKIVVARYGGNYRGYKAKFAEAAGAAGLLIYLDPGDTGYIKGEVYPQGGWQTDLCIQRGSIVTLGYQGDPLTPFVEATEDAERLDVDEVALPKIPVQPIGWGAAKQILVRMDGPEAPAEWQGGLPMSYRLTGGADLRVRVNVQQDRRIAKTANVIARMEGALYPDQWVIVGCHHDAWGFGACDPTCGLISLLESARSFAEEAKAGRPPARTVIFCAWAAEEWGIIGSSEWVEANVDELREKAVAYINLDMASMGPQFGASASPSLRTLVEEAAGLVPQARAPEKTVLEDWVSRSARADDPARPAIGDLGGGSDHVAFVCHAGIPGIAFGSGGSFGSAYHTAYDNLHWYRQVVGEDYEPALMIARMTNTAAGRLAYEPVVPYDLGRNAEFVAGAIDALMPRMEQLAADGDPQWSCARREGAPSLLEECRRLGEAWAAYQSAMERTASASADLQRTICAAESEALQLSELRVSTLAADRAAWHRNILIAPNPESGYGSDPLPGLQSALRTGDGEAAMRAITLLRRLLEGQTEMVRHGAESIPGLIEEEGQ